MSALVRVECSGGTVWYDGPHVVRIDSWRGRLLAARRRVPSPRPSFSRYICHDIWHVCLGGQRDIAFVDERWIEVAW